MISKLSLSFLIFSKFKQAAESKKLKLFVKESSGMERFLNAGSHFLTGSNSGLLSKLCFEQTQEIVLFKLFIELGRVLALENNKKAW